MRGTDASSARSPLGGYPTAATTPSTSLAGFVTLPRPPTAGTQAPEQAVFNLGNGRQDAGDMLVTASGDYSDSTGKGVLIGVLSAFGSAAVAIIILTVFFFFRYTQRGRIMLDRLGRPGEYDDEQAFAREEAEALEVMDDISRSEYLRAKGRCFLHPLPSFLVFRTESPLPLSSSVLMSGYSLCRSLSTGVDAHRHLSVSVSCHSRKGRFCMGIPTRIRDCELFRRSPDRNRVLRFRMLCTD